ncbi:RHS repeat-associated core domain-containing protein [Pseudomonas cremoricolorata]|uniref:RHS repeat-associated core domain-containing protein n=1 Tax=Pseudomonas cremoricolorata TaxID=157783 RepID=UPI001FE2012F|nr:RHS repeat-associated core domain-containing protein [Pseudomonas cremoricolorata]
MKKHTPGALYFYQNRRLQTLKTPEATRTLHWIDGIPLVQNSPGSKQSLMVSDRLGSVLHIAAAEQSEAQALNYSPYGYCDLPSSSQPMAAFNAERPESFGIDYLLGNGYRSFNTRLMRFASADSASPFDEGGINAYCYCGGDPVNNIDPTGHFKVWFPLRTLFRSKQSIIDSSTQRLNHYTNKRYEAQQQFMENRKGALDLQRQAKNSAIQANIKGMQSHISKHESRITRNGGQLPKLAQNSNRMNRAYLNAEPQKYTSNPSTTVLSREQQKAREIEYSGLTQQEWYGDARLRTPKIKTGSANSTSLSGGLLSGQAADAMISLRGAVS